MTEWKGLLYYQRQAEKRSDIRFNFFCCSFIVCIMAIFFIIADMANFHSEGVHLAPNLSLYELIEFLKAWSK